MRIYRSEPVVSMSSSSSTNTSGAFLVETAHFSIHASRVLCSIDPIPFAKVRGPLAERIKSAPQFAAILPKPSVVVTAWWRDRWWETTRLLEAGRRRLSRAMSHENCFNLMEVPTFPYGRDQNVTRVVYDDGSCVDTWRVLLERGNEERLTAQVVQTLQLFFRDVQVPQPRTVKGYCNNSNQS